MNSKKGGKTSKITSFLLLLCIMIFVISCLYINFALAKPLNSEFNKNQNTISNLQSFQKDQVDLLSKINEYRKGLHGLNMILEARKNVISGSDAERPHLVFDLHQVLNDLRHLLPEDARVTKFQLNNKGLITIPVESIDYASLGRVLKSFKEESMGLNLNTEQEGQTKMFLHVHIPSGAQRSVVQSETEAEQMVENVYSLIIQAQLNPEFWSNMVDYSDLDLSAYYAPAVIQLTHDGNLEGYVDNTFKPLQKINRMEFLKLILFEMLARGMITDDEYQLLINPSDESWDSNYRELISNVLGLKFDEIAKFQPGQAISRIEALKTITSLFELEVNPTSPEEGMINLPFTDIEANDENFELIFTAQKKGLLDQMGQELKINSPTSRSEAAYWIWKLKYQKT